MNYLEDFNGFHKYDSISSVRMCGNIDLNPKFSIIIPTYKRPALLKQAIASCLAQTYSDFTITIVDNDGDNKRLDIYKLVKSFSDDRIVYYRNEKNIGVYANTLRGFELSKCEWCVLLNDDDLLHPQYLQILDSAIKSLKLKGVIGSVPMNFTGTVPVVGKYKSFSVRKISKIRFFLGDSITSPGFAFKKEILYDIYNPFEELLMGDQIIQYKGLVKYGLYLIENPCAFYRCSNENETLKDGRVVSMMYNMSAFKSQLSSHNLVLFMYNKFLYKWHTFNYVYGWLSGWKKEHFLYPIMMRLGIHNYPLNWGKGCFLEGCVWNFLNRLPVQRKKIYL